jgi:ankyrin repeat protein
MLALGPDRKNALSWAAEMGYPEICALLISSGGANVHIVDEQDNTALHLAARSGHSLTCALLLEKGADMRALNSEGFTPLDVAGKSKQTTAYALLLEKFEDAFNG